MDVTHRYGQAVDEAWLAAATAEAASEGSVEVRDAVERIDALLRAWAVGFRARTDVTSASLRHGRRGLHADECGTFLLALDVGQLHVDSAGYVTPLCAEPKPGQKPYALCCRDGDAVTVNLEYFIQLGPSLSWLRWVGLARGCASNSGSSMPRAWTATAGPRS